MMSWRVSPVYEGFYSLRARPFGARVGAGACWFPPAINEALRHAVDCLQNGAEIVLISGPPGSGRTTIGQELGRRLAPQRHPVLLGHCEFSQPLEVWRAILFELDRQFTSLTCDEARLAVLQAARELRPDSDSLLVIADDADALTNDLLDELRRLTAQCSEGRPLVQLVLCGTFALEERLAGSDLQQLAQRIARHVALDPLTQDESLEFIRHRVESAGGQLRELLTDAALQAIVRACDGNLTCLTQLCDHALLLGFTNEERPVTETTVAAALDDLKGLSLPWNIPTTQTSTPDASCGDDPIPVSDSESGSLSQDEPLSADETRIDLSPTEETRLVVTTQNSSQSWWDNLGDAATIEVGAEPSTPPATASIAEPRMSPPPDDTPSCGPSQAGHVPDSADIRESIVNDPYAALDRLAESRTADRIPAAHEPTGTTFVWDSPAPSFETEPDDADPTVEAGRPQISNGIETRLLLDVTALRNELRAEATSSITDNRPPVRDMAPANPEWDIVEPEPDVPAPDNRSFTPAADDDEAHKATEPMIDVPELQAAGVQTATWLQNPEARRYARLFTRLKERRAATASDSESQLLRLWR